MSDVCESTRHPLTTAKEAVNVRVASGREGFTEILRHAGQDLVDVLEKDQDPDSPEVREALSQLHDHVDRAMADHAHRQRRWPVRTDGERLTRAFRALDESGVIAREEFGCCDGCAKAALNGELATRNSVPSGQAVRGYAFYHRQDRKNAVAGGPLVVRFEASHPLRRAAVGEETAETLRAHGLTVDWDGDPDRGLLIPMDWSRRRFGRGAAFPGPAVDGEPMVRVSFNDPGSYGVPEWISRYEGRVSVRELSRMVLPWLPRSFVATLSSGHGQTIVLERDFDLLRVHHGPALSRERVEEPLSRWAVGAVWPREEARSSHAGLLEVNYADTAEEGMGFVDYAEPLETAAARQLVYQLTPAKGTFAVFTAANGEVAQMMWESGSLLWMESPSPAEGVSRGRHVTLPEAEEMVRVLAEEGRVALADLGELRTTSW
ncbi:MULTISPECIES: DUF6891 domain-containing protein [Nocardiopsis]|uniref:DUF6891 domain-containing protein n=1 Tax=Nocardiopsis sinuspersici TaxID=501010 RepID=A0A1V3BV25_9ACTN|nr:MULTISPECIES: hypothetical protein [Nocardiopsis]OOC52527.1 hypothetical protein NOSIN_00645 [Nocardiopsis sinuspersici]